MEHSQIPMTFDGELPSAAFAKTDIPRLQVGRRYLVPDRSGKEREGVLLDATVSVASGEAWGVYQLDQSGSVIAACPLTPQELEDFRNDPDTRRVAPCLGRIRYGLGTNFVAAKGIARQCFGRTGALHAEHGARPYKISPIRGRG